MAEVIKTVANGNPGGAFDYGLIQDAIDSVPVNLVTDGNQYTIECHPDGGDFNERPAISGHTVDATQFIKVTAASDHRHFGLAGIGPTINITALGTGFDIADDYTVLEWIEIKGTQGGSTQSTIRVTSANNVIIRKNIIHDADTNIHHGINVINAANPVYVINNFIFGVMGIGINTGGVSTILKAYNNSILGMTTKGIDTLSSGVCDVRGNIAMDSGTDFDIEVGDTQDYNLDSDGTAAGANSLNSKLSANQFISNVGGSENLHLKSMADAIGQSVDLGAGQGVNFDINNRDRDAEGDVWDMGAHQFVNGPQNGEDNRNRRVQVDVLVQI